MRIQKIQAFPLAYPEPHYKGIERYITLARVESERRSRGAGESVFHNSEKRHSQQR